MLALCLVPSCRLFDATGKDRPDAGDGARFVWRLEGYTNSGLPFHGAGTIYYLGFRHELTAVRSGDGALQWSIRLPVDRPRTVGDGGVSLGDKLIVGDEDIFALRASDGSLLWRFDPEDGVDVGRLIPVMWNDLVLAGSSNGYVFAIDAESGELRWKTRLATSPIVGVWLGGVADAVLYVGVTDFSISPNGEPQGSVGALDAA
ncbi:MAG TPA: PQQ-binding-like beta-propeller repeat protein, partial [Gemmatimonadaceae bacterium]